VHEGSYVDYRNGHAPRCRPENGVSLHFPIRTRSAPEGTAPACGLFLHRYIHASERECVASGTRRCGALTAADAVLAGAQFAYALHGRPVIMPSDAPSVDFAISTTPPLPHYLSPSAE
jgi:hypothetical protein